MTCDLALARRWFHMGVGLDGIIAKREDVSYQSGKRTGMEKIKKQRTADCVVAGFRYLEKRHLVGSLLLGLYNDQAAGSRRLHFFYTQRRPAAVNEEVGDDREAAGLHRQSPRRTQPLEHKALHGR